MRRRSYSRGSQRGLGTVVQSFKKVINHAPASRSAAATINMPIATGVDSVAAGQTSAIDVDVPTGSVIKYVEIQFVVANLVSVANYMWVSLIHLRSGQGNVAPDVVGGNPQRNQIHRQKLYAVGANQSSTLIWKIKIPRKYQRVREGDQWRFLSLGNNIHNSAAQIIYKFYR